MTLGEIAYRNLIRRKGKAMFILVGLTVGVSTVVTILSFIEAMTRDINEKVEKFGANIIIVPKTENLNLSYGGISLGGISFDMAEIRESELAGIKSIKNSANVAALGPMLLDVVKVNNRRVLVAGIDFKASNILKPWWKISGSIPNANELLIGSDVASVMNLSIGKFLNMKTQNFKIAGILQPTGSQDDQLIFSHLSTAQELFNKKDRISMAEVAALCSACPIEEMAMQISEILPNAKVMAIQQVVKGRMETLNQFKNFSYGISVVVMLIGSLVILVTMMGSVRERRSEIGIFRAIGFRKRHVIRIVLIEAAIISAISGIIGYWLGLVATKAGLQFFTGNPDAALPLDPQLAAWTFMATVVLGLLASAYPASMAARLDPNDALRSI